MAKFFLIFITIVFLAAGCGGVTLEKNEPTVHQDSYEPLPK